MNIAPMGIKDMTNKRDKGNEHKKKEEDKTLSD